MASTPRRPTRSKSRVLLRSVITLTTDFGLRDAYVGIMHGVILAINPDAKVVDLCHAIPAQDIAAGAFIFETAYSFFPEGTIHTVVVDPGVGSQRPALALQTGGATFVAPDNGVLSPVLRRELPEVPVAGGLVRVSELGANMDVVRLTNDRYWRSYISSTFHGRDIFAPVAAHLSLGLPIDLLGEPAKDLHLLPATRPTLRPDGRLVAHVVHVDNFGNLITDLTAEMIGQAAKQIALAIRGRVVPGIFQYYAQGSGLIALVGSNGRVEIALVGGNAATELAAQVGDEVEVLTGR